MKTKHTLLSSALFAGCTLLSLQAQAELTAGSSLNLDSGVKGCIAGLGTYPACTYGPTVEGGSYFGMDTDGNGTILSSERTALVQNDGLILGTAQAASGSHTGAPDGTETEGIDAAWSFFSNTGMHFTSSATNVLSASGNTATVDFSGWNVTWNSIPAINMGSGAWAGNADGVAMITCDVDCGDGDTYTLDYSATVPLGDPSGFGGVSYQLHLEGTIVIPNDDPSGEDFPYTAIASTNTHTINISGHITDDNYTTSNTITITNPSAALQACGTVIDNGDGNVTFPACIDGEYTFDYSVVDDLGAASTANTVTATLTNTAPVAADLARSTLIATPVTVDVSGNATDADSGDEPTNTIVPASVTVITDGSTGNCVANDPADGDITYTPTGGDDSCTYTIDDTIGATSNIGTLNFTVVAALLPIANNDSPTTGVANTTIAKNGVAVIDVLGNDTHPDSSDTIDSSTVAIVTVPSNGAITNIDNTTGAITYTPNTDWAGEDTFTYTVNDRGLNGGVQTSNEGTVTVVVTNVVPVANDVNLSTTANTANTVDVSNSASDSDGSLNLASVSSSNGNNGTTSVNAGVITYTPATGFAGTDSFTYTVADDNGDISNTATVTVTVNILNTPATPATFSVGTTAAAAGSTTGVISMENIGVADTNTPPEDRIVQSCIGGCFDFELSGLTPGATGSVVLPLSTPVPAKADPGNTITYRKLINGTWRTFDRSTGDTFRSAPGTRTDDGVSCPQPSSDEYIGLTAGHNCLLLNISDGGPNDADGGANGTVVDPGGLAEITRVTGTDGCSMGANANAKDHAEWLLLAGFIALLGWFNIHRRKA